MPVKKVKAIKKKVVKKSTVKKIVVKKAVTEKSNVKKILTKRDIVEKTMIVKPTNGVKRGSLTIDVFDLKGNVMEQMILPAQIFGAKINDKLMTQAVRIYLANQRGGFAVTKTRANVHGSTRKIYKQKGTGGARHGSKKAPIFIHGGIAHGPDLRDYSLKISKKMKKLALFSALSMKLKDSQIKGLIGFEKIQPKTKLMAQAISKLGIGDKDRNVLIVTPKKDNGFENFYRATKNIEGIKLLPANTLNTYEILNSKLILITKPSIDIMIENFLKGEK